MSQTVPRDFSRFRAGTTQAIAHEAHLPWVRGVIEREPLYAWAAQQPDRRSFLGRVPAFSVPAPELGTRVVVRRSHHGGLLGPLRRDLFLPPTRAPYELLVSHLLASVGVRTPPVVAIAVYRAGPVLRRSDVVSLEVPGRDLGAALSERPGDEVRRAWLAPVAHLIRALSAVGAWHPDLNIKNILLVGSEPTSMDAYVLDVDRILFHPPGDPAVQAANLDRLERSVRKWRARFGAGFADDELRELRALTATAPAPA